MDFKEIKNTKHYLYDNKEEFSISSPDGVVRHNWRHGEEGEWIYTDDGYVCQVLRLSKIGKKMCLRTLCGTFNTDFKTKMLGEDGIVDNIYSFSGKHSFNSDSLSIKQLLFAQYIGVLFSNIILFFKSYLLLVYLRSLPAQSLSTIIAAR